MDSSQDNPLLVSIDRIGDGGLQIDTPVTDAWLREALGESSPFSPTAPGRLKVQLYVAEDVVHVRGRLSVELTADCSRCLNAVLVGFDGPIEVALFPVGSEPAATPGGAPEDTDTGISTYANRQVNLADLMRDEVFLELPMNPICSETCAGLCHACGVNLNETNCTCKPLADPRWSGLQHIKPD